MLLRILKLVLRYMMKNIRTKKDKISGQNLIKILYIIFLKYGNKAWKAIQIKLTSFIFFQITCCIYPHKILQGVSQIGSDNVSRSLRLETTITTYFSENGHTFISYRCFLPAATTLTLNFSVSYTIKRTMGL